MEDESGVVQNRDDAPQTVEGEPRARPLNNRLCVVAYQNAGTVPDRSSESGPRAASASSAEATSN